MQTKLANAAPYGPRGILQPREEHCRTDLLLSQSRLDDHKRGGLPPSTYPGYRGRPVGKGQRDYPQSPRSFDFKDNAPTRTSAPANAHTSEIANHPASK